MSLKDKLRLLLSLSAATLIVAGGVFLILRQGAPLMDVGSIERASTSPMPPVAPSEQGAAAPPTTRGESTAGSGIYRCAENGNTVYANSPCPRGKEIDIRIAQGFLPPNTATTSRPAATGRTLDPPTGAVSERAATAAGSASDARCALLRKQIDEIDAAARRGGSAAYQDHLREQRRKLVEKRYEWKC